MSRHHRNPHERRKKHGGGGCMVKMKLMNVFRHNWVRSAKNQKWLCQPPSAPAGRHGHDAVVAAPNNATPSVMMFSTVSSLRYTSSAWIKTATAARIGSSGSNRHLSTTAAPADVAAGSNDKKEQEDKNKKNESKPNLFLDNLGTIFLTVIGLIIASLVRSFYGSTRKNDLRKQLEEVSALDPLEVDDLRFANPFVSVPVFRALIADVREAFPDGQATYRDVVHVVRKALQSKHAIPTIELGYLLDRVALQVSQEAGITTAETQSVTLWLVLLSLALNAPIPDRIRILYEIMETDNATGGGSSSTVTLLKVRDLVSYLQSTSQLVLDTQVLPTENQAYPIQSYHRGTPDELVRWDAGGLHDPIDIDALAEILRSKSVCAWGECYSKQKFI